MCELQLALQVAGQVLQGRAEASAAKANAQIAANNAELARRERAAAIEAGKEEESSFRQKLRKIQGEQRVGFAASGVSLASGSPADVLTDTAVLGELDALTIRDNAARRAFGFEVEEANYLTEQRLQKNRARQSSLLLPFQIGTTIASSKRFQEFME